LIEEPVVIIIMNDTDEKAIQISFLLLIFEILGCFGSY